MWALLYWNPICICGVLISLNSEFVYYGMDPFISKTCFRHRECLAAPATSLGARAMNPGSWATHLAAWARSLGAPGMAIELSGKSNIFFVNTAGAPGNCSYYLLLNAFWNSCMHFVISSMYQCIYIAIHLHTVYLDWLQLVLEKCEVHLKMAIEWT